MIMIMSGKWARFYRKKIIYYGLTEEADLYADNITTTRTGMEFNVHYGNEVEKIKMDRSGLHNVYNALAAIAVARSWESAGRR